MTPSVTHPDQAQGHLPDKSPLLRTLSPALRGLERGLRGWLDGPHEYPLTTLGRATLEGLSTDLRRQSDALDVERPVLIVALMGGTGVGKSTLLNALAGGNVALASFTRPTTRDPVVYYHESVRPDRLDPALRHCRLVSHDRRQLEQKVLVDTPDLDSTDLTNRDKTLRLLPVADVVLFVGSQEKYHDQLGWDIFRQQRKRRAFAFVMNKWDRCLHAGAAGLRPDEDLIRDLEAEGFVKPLVFRTCAQAWVDRATAGHHAELPEGEQFQELLAWLELGLSRLEIEAIKARGVSQMIVHLQQALRDVAPPDLTEVAQRTRKAWAAPLGEEARATADVLVNTIEPFQREIEHHFTLAGHGRFRGMMAWYLGLFDKAKYAGSHLKPRIPFISRSNQPAAEAPSAWDLSLFSSACGDIAGSRELDGRGRALVNRLLVSADGQGYPLTVLTDPVEAVGRIEWRQRWASSLTQVLDRVEKQSSSPTGPRQAVQGTLVLLADWLPPLALLGALVMVLIRFFDPWNVGYQFTWHHALLPGLVLLLVLVLLHVLIAILLPMRWRGIRDELHRQLDGHVEKELEAAYLPLPVELAARLNEERRRVEKLCDEASEVGAWLEKREQASSIAGLYGT